MSDAHEEKIERSALLLELDDEFRDSNLPMIERFFQVILLSFGVFDVTSSPGALTAEAHPLAARMRRNARERTRGDWSGCC